MELLVFIGALSVLGALANLIGSDGADVHRRARTRWII
jgi:hypothetical protein